MRNETKIILDLCGGTGAWSMPYKEAGYDVHIVTLPSANVLDYEPPDNTYGILAAPPCTHFSFARCDKTARVPRNFPVALEVVDACMQIIRRCSLTGNLMFWALENPKGYLRRFLGKAPFEFDPCDFGDPWTKRTELWGYFNFPRKKPVKPLHKDLRYLECPKNGISTVLPKLPSDYMFKMGGGNSWSHKRAITPPGFARAFFMANR